MALIHCPECKKEIEIFGIPEHFDNATEQMFETFYRDKQEILVGNHEHLSEFLDIGRTLSQKSIEVQNIVGREMRQLQRVTGKENEEIT